MASESIENSNKKVKEYWTNHNVTMHKEFTTVEESIEYMHWRNDQYFNLKESMPVSGFDNKDVLDFGCGPGNDIVGFGEYSNCRRLVGADVSASSLQELQNRVSLHSFNVEIELLEPESPSLPFDDASFDHIHCAGVLHHMNNPAEILREFSRVLRTDGTIHIMVYNYYSLWVHLYVAYQLTLVENFHPDAELLDRFRMSTDGVKCPISNCYRPDEWIRICKESGLDASFLGAGISMHEMMLLPTRFNAIQDRRLPRESREFLIALEFCKNGYPLYKNNYAGIDGFYLAKKI